MDTLPGDRFKYHENTRKIIGERSRRQFSIGDKVRVRLDRVDASRKETAVFLRPSPSPNRRAATAKRSRRNQRALLIQRFARRPRFPSPMNPQPLIRILPNHAPPTRAWIRCVSARTSPSIDTSG